MKPLSQFCRGHGLERGCGLPAESLPESLSFRGPFARERGVSRERLQTYFFGMNSSLLPSL